MSLGAEISWRHGCCVSHPSLQFLLHVSITRHHRLHSFLDLSLGTSTDMKARPSAFHFCHRDCPALFPECWCWDSSLRFSFSRSFSFSVFGNTRLLTISSGSGQDLQQSGNVTFANTITSGITIHVRASPMGEMCSPHGLSLVPNTCHPAQIL